MPRLTSSVRAMCCTLAWLVLGVWGWLLLGPMYLHALRPSPDNVVDFYQDWGSSRNYLTGLPVYAEHSISIPHHLGLPRNPVPSIKRNAHPPTAVLLTLPLAWLSYSDAVLVWNLISLIALLVSILIVARELAATKALVLPGVVLSALCQPLYAHLYLGQWTLLLLLLVVAAWVIDRRERPAAAGALLGLAAAIKLFPAYLFVLYAAQRRLKPLLSGMATLLCVTLITLAVLGPESYRDYLWEVLPSQSVFRGFMYNFSVAGFWHKLFDPVGEAGALLPLWPSPSMARIGTLVCDLGITATVIGLAYRWRRPEERDAAFGLAVTAMLLVSPVTWNFSLPLLLVPLAQIATEARRSTTRGLALWAILLVVWMPQEFLTALLWGSSIPASPVFSLGAASAKFYALLGTFALGVALMLDRVDMGRHLTTRPSPPR